MRLLFFTLSIAILLLCGCEKDVQSIEQDEEKHPLMQEGQAYLDTQNWDQAEQSFKSAINVNHRMARPHLELANIYHQHKGPSSVDNYEYFVEAIYHYKRYLELRPNTEKKTFILDQMHDAKNQWANAVFKKLGISNQIEGANSQIKKLEQEIQRLRTTNNELNRRLSGASGSQLAKTAPKSSQKQQAPAEAPRTNTPKKEPQHKVYNVVEGDTLSAIAKKFYGSSGKWDVIYQANRDRMKSPGDLDIGQTIIIPNLPE